MISYLLDSNAISDLIHDPIGPVASRVALIGSPRVGASIIAAAEIRYGGEKRGSERLSQRIETVLSAMTIMPFQRPAEREYGRLRAGLERTGSPIGHNDLLIAAHALALDCILVTDNEREFRRVPGLRVENWLRQT